ncbi:hypothetical protein F5148DRAFT_1278804 [Russula earlei]|uniref:Uncharacterized protein n=1 Tax=Russula earlei TaxID=71964 RepID=A0ACC0UPB0_9AGAM|nr:hypothetical protein F5148DRAFT_1278804 [Russula earlei]
MLTTPVEEDDSVCTKLIYIAQVFTFADTFLWVQPPTSEFAQLKVQVAGQTSRIESAEDPIECDKSNTDQGGHDKEDANGLSPISSGDEPEQTKAKDVVANIFNFQHTYNLTIIANQCTRVAELKHDFTYIYQQTTGRSSFLKSRAIQDIINKVWFQNSSKSKPDAIIFHDQYDPFPLVAIALTLSVRTGSYSPVAFTVADYKHVFEDAHEMLQSFDQAMKDLGILLALQKAIFTGGCVYGKSDAEEGSRSHQNSLSEDTVKKAIEEHQNGIDWSNDEDVEWFKNIS